jgi:hypothetical protein
MPRRRDIGRWVVGAEGQFVWKDYERIPPSPPPKPGPPKPPPPGNVRIPVDVPLEVMAALERAIAYRWSLRSPEERARTPIDYIDAKPLSWEDRGEGWRMVGVIYELLGHDALSLEVWLHFGTGRVRVERPRASG